MLEVLEVLEERNLILFEFVYVHLMKICGPGRATVRGSQSCTLLDVPVQPPGFQVQIGIIIAIAQGVPP